MADSHESNEDHLWEIERIALAYEVALKQAGCKDSIESLLVSNLHLPRAALLKALVETELDVLGVVEGSLARYEHRFPQDGPLLRSIFDAPLDDVRPPLKEGEMVASFASVGCWARVLWVMCTGRSIAIRIHPLRLRSSAQIG
ncbi:MAG: hypothetical protein R3C56_20820 [Pirellulaceae bacterium]